MFIKILFIIIKTLNNKIYNNKNIEVINEGRLGDYVLITKECHRVKQNDSLKIT